SQAKRKAKMTSAEATMPTAVAARYLSARSENKNGANDPITMFHSCGSQSGTTMALRFPPSDTVVPSAPLSSFHQSPNANQNRAEIAIVQKTTARGDILPTIRSPMRKYEANVTAARSAIATPSGFSTAVQTCATTASPMSTQPIATQSRAFTRSLKTKNATSATSSTAMYSRSRAMP